MLHPSRQRGALAEMLVAYRFMEAGRLVSWPLVPCAYDLVVDGGDRLYRVQVKQAFERDDAPHAASGHWKVRLTKRHPQGDTPLPIAATDYVCVVATPAEIYVIPAAACASFHDTRYFAARLQIGPHSKYQIFRNTFTVGSGLSEEIVPTPVVAFPPARRYQQQTFAPPRARGERKAYRRLTPAEIDQIRQLPIRWFKRDPAEGRLPLAQVAQQFDVTPLTLRNVVLRGNRLDLRRA